MVFLIGDLIPLAPIGGGAPAAEPTAYELYVALQNQLLMWQMGFAFMFILFVMSFIFFLPFLPWLLAKFTRKPLIALMDKTGDVRFRHGVELKNGMYHFNNRPLYFVKKYPGAFRFAGVLFDFAHIDLGFVQHPVYNNFVHELRKMGYKDWKAIDTALEFNTIPVGDNKMAYELGFESYEHAKKALNPKGLTTKSEILAPYFASCCLDELIGYGADVPPPSIAGQVDDIVQSQKSEDAKSNTQQWFWIIAIVVILVGGALAYKMLTG